MEFHKIMFQLGEILVKFRFLRIYHINLFTCIWNTFFIIFLRDGSLQMV
jgi:hypothetical protein